MNRYKLIDTSAVFEGFLRINRYRLRHSSFSGGWCPDIVRERIEGLSAVSVLLYDPAPDVLVLVEQFRIGLVGVQPHPWTLETVSGFCDLASESPEQVARREVREETGAALRRLRHIGAFHVSPGISVERIHLYCGLVDAATASGIHGLAAEGEETRVVKLPRAVAVAELYRSLASTSVIMALQWLEANRDALLQEWAG